MKCIKISIAIVFIVLISSCSNTKKIISYGPLPSHRQLMWHEMEYYGFIHFNMNTFTNMEWGMGNESPESFNPTELDARQWARVAKEAGMKGIILTASIMMDFVFGLLPIQSIQLKTPHGKMAKEMLLESWLMLVENMD